MPDSEINKPPTEGKDVYERIARAYAAAVDNAPYNVYYERPAVMSLLPDLVGLNVLDAGCGSGWYAETLLSKGATVTAVDINQDFLQLTRERVGDRAVILEADLAKPFNFAEDNTFDLVVAPLSLHYIADWVPTLREFHRVLKPEGVLVFSTHHPHVDYKHAESPNYLQVELMEQEWSAGKVVFYRRPLSNITNALRESGFSLDLLLEPTPVEGLKEVDRERYFRLLKEPAFLVIRAIVLRQNLGGSR